MDETDTALNGWNGTIERNVVKIGEQSLAARWMHYESIRHYRFQYNRLNIVTRILTTIIATIVALAFVSSNVYYVVITRILTVLISAVVVYVTMTLKSDNFPDLIIKHRLSAYYYSNLVQNINKEMAFHPQNRQNATVFFDYITNEFNKLRIGSPDIEERIQIKFERKYGDEEVAKPYELHHIEVCRNGESNSSDSSRDSEVVEEVKKWGIEMQKCNVPEQPQDKYKQYQLDRFIN